MALYLKILNLPFTQEWFVPSLVEIGPVVMKKMMKMWKVYEQTGDRQSEKKIYSNHNSIVFIQV